MYKHNEALLQFIWQHKLWKPTALLTVSGQRLHVLNAGTLNHESGPDFFNAHIELNDVCLYGNVEIHIQTSDWLKHGHQNDARYNQLILHVVYEHDVQLLQNQKYGVEILELKHYLTQNTLDKYAQLMAYKKELPCKSQWPQLDLSTFQIWLQRMWIERLELKMQDIKQLWMYFNQDELQTFYTLLLKAFGFNTNGIAFELLAKHLPLRILQSHQQNIQETKALLIGTVGLLETPVLKTELAPLKPIYNHLKKHYQLETLPSHLVTTGAVRPQNSPQKRLLQFATLIHHCPFVLSQPLSAQTLSLFTHSTFKKKRRMPPPYLFTATENEALFVTVGLGLSSQQSLMVNALIPFLFFKGQINKHEPLCEGAIALLDTLAFENNRKTQAFKTHVFKFTKATHSQALIHLHDHFCVKKACLKCAIGLKILQKEVYLTT